MIREFLGKKAAQRVDKSKYGQTRIGKVATTILDDERLENFGLGGLDSGLESNHAGYSMPMAALIANLVYWPAVLLAPSVVSKFVIAFSLIFLKGWVLLLAPVLGLTMFGIYSLLRKKFPERDDQDDAGDVMQSYAHQSDSLLTWKLWVVSCGIAAVDVILLVVAYLNATGEWDF